MRRFARHPRSTQRAQTLQEAAANLVDAIALILVDRLEEGLASQDQAANAPSLI
jgi:predicted RNase H-like HicB family nuclease